LCIIYLCQPISINEKEIKLSFEHDAYGLFTEEEIQKLNMPGKYKETIKIACRKAITRKISDINQITA
jgi:hypothetical protein